MAFLPHAVDRLSSERGFTLIELLVVIATGMVVASALFTILDVTLHQTTRTFSRVDATQRSRTAIETIENELHSACVANEVRPILVGSSDTSVSFVSGYGSAASVTPVEHQITFASSTLTDTTYASTGASGPNTWNFSSTPQSTVTLLTNVAQSGSTPVFRYYAYATPKDSSGVAYTDAAGNPYQMLLDGTSTVPGTNIIPSNSPTPLATPLSATDAPNAAEVQTTLVVSPAGGSMERTDIAADTVSDSVVLRLTTIANHDDSNNFFEPCS